MQADIETHPLYHYADFALNTIRQRFPQGAGNRVDAVTHNPPPDIFENMSKFSKFSSAENPNATEFAALIAGLQNASADILVSYALGALRLQHPGDKALFSCWYINQEIPNAGRTTGAHQQTHAVLVIGDALICDLWSREVYKMSDFERKRVTEPSVTMCFIWYNITLKFPIGLYLCAIRPLHGQISTLSCDNAESFFQVLEKLVTKDSHSSSAAASRTTHSTQNHFFASSLGQRDTWESAHKKIVGYVTDEQGHSHTIRRLGDTKRYAYWNHHSHMPTFIKFVKNTTTGEYHSDLGVLSTKRPTKDTQSAVNKLNNCSLDGGR